MDYEINNKEEKTHTVQVSIKLPNEKKDKDKVTLFEDVSGASSKFARHWLKKVDYRSVA